MSKAIKGIDLDLLIKQKMSLLNTIENCDNPTIEEDLEGLLTLLDVIHDELDPPEPELDDDGDEVNYIEVRWSTVDAKMRARDMFDVDLTIDEASEVISRAENHHDANTGISWEVLDVYIDDVISERTNITNKYHCPRCDKTWELENCDSEHNDRCDVCGDEMTPYESENQNQ
jgi:hypothetical protein